ncbi:DUF1275 family protein [Paraburkholderia sediminicola]|uniref:DUF1275 family protein n=1 Tax=Paraburkholderia sediminicola TaxID=458836 RepID=UPI0038B8A383
MTFVQLPYHARLLRVGDWIRTRASVYVLCFVGGCMECISFTLLFHSLLGVMTVNTMMGVIGVVQKIDVRQSILHLMTVFAFLALVLAHNIISLKRKRMHRSIRNLRCLAAETVLVFIFACGASFLYRHGMMREANVSVFAFVCLGSVALYLQNYVVQLDIQFPTATMVMTGNYIALIVNASRVIARSADREKAVPALKHYVSVHLSFWFGVLVMAIVSRDYDFLSLLLSCALLAILTIAFAMGDHSDEHAAVALSAPDSELVTSESRTGQ